MTLRGGLMGGPPSLEKTRHTDELGTLWCMCGAFPAVDCTRRHPSVRQPASSSRSSQNPHTCCNWKGKKEQDSAGSAAAESGDSSIPVSPVVPTGVVLTRRMPVLPCAAAPLCCCPVLQM